MCGARLRLSLEPQLSRWPEIEHTAIIELKYIKKAGRKPTKAELAAIKTEAIRELDRYSADTALAAKWRLRPVGSPTSKVECPTTNLSTFQPLNLSTHGAAGSVILHRLVLVFHGGDCLMREEV